MIKAAGRASVGKIRTTPKTKENVKTAVGIHSVSCVTAFYIPGHVQG